MSNFFNTFCLDDDDDFQSPPKKTAEKRRKENLGENTLNTARSSKASKSKSSTIVSSTSKKQAKLTSNGSIEVQLSSDYEQSSRAITNEVMKQMKSKAVKSNKEKERLLENANKMLEERINEAMVCKHELQKQLRRTRLNLSKETEKKAKVTSKASMLVQSVAPSHEIDVSALPSLTSTLFPGATDNGGDHDDSNPSITTKWKLAQQTIVGLSQEHMIDLGDFNTDDDLRGPLDSLKKKENDHKDANDNVPVPIVAGSSNLCAIELLDEDDDKQSKDEKSNNKENGVVAEREAAASSTMDIGVQASLVVETHDGSTEIEVIVTQDKCIQTEVMEDAVRRVHSKSNILRDDNAFDSEQKDKDEEIVDNGYAQLSRDPQLESDTMEESFICDCVYEADEFDDNNLGSSGIMTYVPAATNQSSHTEDLASDLDSSKNMIDCTSEPSLENSFPSWSSSPCMEPADYFNYDKVKTMPDFGKLSQLEVDKLARFVGIEPFSNVRGVLAGAWECGRATWLDQDTAKNSKKSKSTNNAVSKGTANSTSNSTTKRKERCRDNEMYLSSTQLDDDNDDEGDFEDDCHIRKKKGSVTSSIEEIVSKLTKNDKVVTFSDILLYLEEHCFDIYAMMLTFHPITIEAIYEELQTSTLNVSKVMLRKLLDENNVFNTAQSAKQNGHRSLGNAKYQTWKK